MSKGREVSRIQARTARQRRVWDRAADGYDKQMSWPDRLLFAGGREWLAQRARGRVLEVAIGTGLSLPHYAPAVRVTGVELSPQMLARARERAERLGRDVELVEGDAAALPVGDAAYDTAVCSLGLCTIPDPVAAIAEMRRALVPGGRLLLLDHVGSTWPPVYALQWVVERLTVPLAGEHFTRRQLPLVRAAGFEIVETERLKAGVVERVHATKPA
jgi:ubiquinone/menaquinone biosynthesis C-methylase UbiE